MFAYLDMQMRFHGKLPSLPTPGANVLGKFRKTLAFQISHIAIDEAHLPDKWGKNKFRPKFLKIPQLRSMVPEAKVLALTATATKSAQEDIINLLCMLEVEKVTDSPDR